MGKQIETSKQAKIEQYQGIEYPEWGSAKYNNCRDCFMGPDLPLATRKPGPEKQYSPDSAEARYGN